jgi:translation initiation factor 3 subunit M
MLMAVAEFTAAYNLLIHLSNQSPSRDKFLARICSYLSEQPVASSAQFGPSLALTTLTTIFNILPNESSSRYHVFLAILKVIRSTSNNAAFDALTPQLETNVPKWVEAWNLDDEDARSLHIAIADVAAASGNNDMSYKYLLHGLESIPPQSASDSEGRDLAKRTLIAALTNPTITDFNPLIDREAIQALRDSDAGLFDLLNIFASDDYSSYTDFVETNPLSSLNLPESAAETLETKIRLLTLASLAAGAANRSLPYSTISDELQIPNEDVEMWVIDTIRAGLVEGKLSQLKQEFLVQRANYRVFGPKQWSEIQGRLMVWQGSLEGVLSLVKTEREKFAREGAGMDDAQQGGERRFGGYRGQGGRGRNQPNHQGREMDFVGGD